MSTELTISRRPVAEPDSAFLEQLYHSTREEELRLFPWTEDQKAAFVRSQFRAQTLSWAISYPAATRELILIDGRPAGRLYLDRRPEPGVLHVIDISLSPAFRGRGIGTTLFQAIFAEADRQGWKVSLHVQRQNPARRLYARLGFRPVADESIDLLLERGGSR